MYVHDTTAKCNLYIQVVSGRCHWWRDWSVIIVRRNLIIIHDSAFFLEQCFNVGVSLITFFFSKSRIALLDARCANVFEKLVGMYIKETWYFSCSPQTTFRGTVVI